MTHDHPLRIVAGAAPPKPSVLTSQELPGRPLGRREFLTGVGKGFILVSLVPSAPMLVSACSSPATPLVISAVAAFAAVVDSVPEAKSIGEWVKGDGADQQVGARVREEFRRPENLFVNEEGAQVHLWRSCYFFAAATEDGGDGCCAFVAAGQLLQLVEGHAAEALRGVARSAQEMGNTPQQIGQALMPAAPTEPQNQIGRLKAVGDAFRYKAATGNVEMELSAPDRVTVHATLPGGRYKWDVPTPPSITG